MAKTDCPSPFPISPALRDWAAKNVPRLDLVYHTAEFEDYWRGHGKRMANWDATWRNWMRRSMEYKPKLLPLARPIQGAVTPIFRQSGDTLSRAEALKLYGQP